MRIVKQNRFKNLGELHKERTEAGVKASRATTHRRVKEFGYSSIQFKFICIAHFTIQSLQSALQEIKFLQYIYTL